MRDTATKETAKPGKSGAGRILRERMACHVEGMLAHGTWGIERQVYEHGHFFFLKLLFVPPLTVNPCEHLTRKKKHRKKMATPICSGC